MQAGPGITAALTGTATGNRTLGSPRGPCRAAPQASLRVKDEARGPALFRRDGPPTGEGAVKQIVSPLSGEGGAIATLVSPSGVSEEILSAVLAGRLSGMNEAIVSRVRTRSLPIKQANVSPARTNTLRNRKQDSASLAHR